MIGITIGISLVIIANNSNKEKTITFHDERAERAVPAVASSFFVFVFEAVNES